MIVLLVMQLYAALCSKVKKGEASLLAAISKFIINCKLFMEASVGDHSNEYLMGHQNISLK